MSLFEQQPMGPVPARRPVRQPPDPELDEEVADQGPVEVQILGPLPPELAYGAPAEPRSRPRRWLSGIVAFALLMPSVFGIGYGLVGLVAPEASFAERSRIPGVIVGVGTVVIVVLALLLRRRPRPSVDVNRDPH